MIAMLEKEEDSRTLRDIVDIEAFIGKTDFAQNSGYDLDSSDK